MKKISVNNLFIFLLGLTCLSLGIVLVIKSNLGISVAMSVPYVFSLYFTKISLGQWSYIIQGIVLLLLVIIVRKLTVKYLMSFIVAFLFGLAIDLFNVMLVSVVASTLLERVGLFILASVVISIGVASFMKSNYPILPFDTFVKEVSLVKNIKYSKFKTGYDLTSFTVSLTASLIFFRKIHGLNIGTLVSALVLGSTIGACLNFMNKHIDGKSILPEEKTKRILDFDLLNASKSKNLKEYN